MSMSYNYPPEYAFPSAPPLYRAFPAPPRLHWGIVLALSIVTIGLFGMVWLLVQAHWVKKVTRDGKPFAWCLAYLLSLPAVYMAAFVGGLLLAILHQPDTLAMFTAILIGVTRLGMFVLYVFAAFTLKGALEAQPIDIPLSGVMTFFFSATYFQYHLFDYSVDGKVAEQLSGFAEPTPAAAVAELPPQA
jgi:hypothetical protein